MADNLTEVSPDLRANLGRHRVPPVSMSQFPDAGAAVQTLTSSTRPSGSVDVLLVNPPSPDGGIWIRSQHRVGRRSRENMIWPQVSLAQLAAILAPEYTVKVVDCIATRMSWPEFEKLLDEIRPRYYVTHVTAPTLRNDMYGVFLAKSVGAQTMAFGTHVTPMTLETMRPFPALDYVLRGEPEMTLRELLDRQEERTPSNPAVAKMLAATSGLAAMAGQRLGRVRIQEPGGAEAVAPITLALSADPPPASDSPLATVRGLAWRKDTEIIINPDRPFIPSLDDLPMPLHELLPLDRQRMPMIKGPFTFIVTSRGCPAGCKYCIKHVSYQNSVRLRAPEKILMAKAGCWYISWGIESANEQILKRARKGYRKEQAFKALTWSKAAGINNWGYFIIGLPGETETTIQETITYAKELPLDIALFHIAAPYPGTPFFYEVVENNWFRAGTKWEEVDMDQSTVLDYPSLPAERLEYWQKRATREWSLRPAPILTFVRGLNTWEGFKSAVSVGWQTLKFVRS